MKRLEIVECRDWYGIVKESLGDAGKIEDRDWNEERR